MSRRGRCDGRGEKRASSAGETKGEKGKAAGVGMYVRERPRTVPPKRSAAGAGVRTLLCIRCVCACVGRWLQVAARRPTRRGGRRG
jgi:hypothetical protein